MSELVICENAANCNYEPHKDALKCSHKIPHKRRDGCQRHCLLDESIHMNDRYVCTVVSFLSYDEFKI